MGTCATGDREAETETRATGGPPPRRPRRSAPHADGRVDVTPRTCGAEGGAEARRRERGRGDERPAQRPRGLHHRQVAGRGGAPRQRDGRGHRHPARMALGVCRRRRAAGRGGGRPPPDETLEISAPRGRPRGDVSAYKRRGEVSAARRRRRNRGWLRRSSPSSQRRQAPRSGGREGEQTPAVADMVPRGEVAAEASGWTWRSAPCADGRAGMSPRTSGGEKEWRPAAANAAAGGPRRSAPRADHRGGADGGGGTSPQTSGGKG